MCSSLSIAADQNQDLSPWCECIRNKWDTFIVYTCSCDNVALYTNNLRIYSLFTCHNRAHASEPHPVTPCWLQDAPGSRWVLNFEETAVVAFDLTCTRRILTESSDFNSSRTRAIPHLLIKANIGRWTCNFDGTNWFFTSSKQKII